MIINGYGKDGLCPVLPDNVFVEVCLDIRRLGKAFKLKLGGLLYLLYLVNIVGNDAHAQADAFIADVCAVAGNKPVCDILRFAAERASYTFSIISSCHSFTSNRAV